jgi:hypothetical protein
MRETKDKKTFSTTAWRPVPGGAVGLLRLLPAATTTTTPTAHACGRRHGVHLARPPTRHKI